MRRANVELVVQAVPGHTSSRVMSANREDMIISNNQRFTYYISDTIT